MIHGMTSGEASSVSQLETELAVLARTLEGMSRRSEVHRDLDRSSYLIARTLVAAGTPTVTGLAGQLGLDGTTVTRQVSTMEAEGLVVRRMDPEDKRVRYIELTTLGERRMRKVQRAREKRIGDLVARWSSDDQIAFSELLARFNQALSDHTKTG